MIPKHTEIFRVTISTLLMCCMVSACFSQDTILLSTKQYLSSEQYPSIGKDFVYRVGIGNEGERIVYSDSLRTIEYCYYYDSVRTVYRTDSFVFHDDSVLVLNGREWIYYKVNGGWSVHSMTNGLKETGIVKRLFPFEKTGRFITVSPDDTPIYSYDYAGMFALILFYDQKLKGKVYDAGMDERFPILANGDTLKLIRFARKHHYYGEPMIRIQSVSFVVTKAGKFVNPSVQGDPSGRPEYLMDLIAFLYKKGSFKPALKNGKVVNMRYVVPLDASGMYEDW